MTSNRLQEMSRPIIVLFLSFCFVFLIHSVLAKRLWLNRSKHFFVWHWIFERFWVHGVPGVFLALLTRSKISDQLIQPARGILFYHVQKSTEKTLDNNYCFTTSPLGHFATKIDRHSIKNTGKPFQEQNSHETHPEKNTTSDVACMNYKNKLAWSSCLFISGRFACKTLKLKE